MVFDVWVVLVNVVNNPECIRQPSPVTDLEISKSIHDKDSYVIFRFNAVTYMFCLFHFLNKTFGKIGYFMFKPVTMIHVFTQSKRKTYMNRKITECMNYDIYSDKGRFYHLYK